MFSKVSNKLGLLLKTSFTLADVFVLNSSFVVNDDFHFEISTLLCVFDDDGIFVCS